MIRVTGNQDNDANIFNEATRSMQGDITGALSVEMAGIGTLVLKGRAFSSTGDLCATNGVLELAADATWLNGTNFTAKGEGTLKFASKDQVTGRNAWLHIADNGKVYVPEGVTMRFAAATLNGEPVGKGLYHADDDKALSAHIEGGGSIRIKRPGTILIVQ